MPFRVLFVHVSTHPTPTLLTRNTLKGVFKNKEKKHPKHNPAVKKQSRRGSYLQQPGVRHGDGSPACTWEQVVGPERMALTLAGSGSDTEPDSSFGSGQLPGRSCVQSRLCSEDMEQAAG